MRSTRPCSPRCACAWARAPSLPQPCPLSQTTPIPPPPPAEATRAAPVFHHQHNVAVATSGWISALMSDWDSAVRNPSADALATDRPGYRLATAMSMFVVAVFSQRRHLLSTSDAFRSRSRDPVAHVATSVAAISSSIPTVPLSPGSLTPTTQPRGLGPGAFSMSSARPTLPTARA